MFSWNQCDLISCKRACHVSCSPIDNIFCELWQCREVDSYWGPEISSLSSLQCELLLHQYSFLVVIDTSTKQQHCHTLFAFSDGSHSLFECECECECIDCNEWWKLQQNNIVLVTRIHYSRFLMVHTHTHIQIKMPRKHASHGQISYIIWQCNFIFRHFCLMYPFPGFRWKLICCHHPFQSINNYNKKYIIYTQTPSHSHSSTIPRNRTWHVSCSRPHRQYFLWTLTMQRGIFICRPWNIKPIQLSMWNASSVLISRCDRYFNKYTIRVLWWFTLTLTYWFHENIGFI